MADRTLVVVAHMDDESLNTAGLIQARIAAGSQVFVLVLFGRKYEYGRVQVTENSDEYEDFLSACHVLGVRSSSCPFLEEGEPGKVGYYACLEQVESALRFFGPMQEVVIPSELDLNQDHRFLADVCKIALRPANLAGLRRVLVARAFDSRLAPAQYYVPMSEEQMSKKLEAVACYRRESRTGVHPRSPQNIVAMHRVLGAQCGHEYAEGYGVHLIRE